MTSLLGALQAIAEASGAYMLLVHHQGHAGGERGVVGAGRGSSAIAAVARAVWHLERVPGEARLRKLRVEGNSVPDRELELEVAGPDADPPGAVLYFRPQDRLRAYELDDLIEPGEAISTRTLTVRLAGDSEPVGTHQRLAAELRNRWEREGLVRVFKGARGAKMIERLG